MKNIIRFAGQLVGYAALSASAVIGTFGGMALYANVIDPKIEEMKAKKENKKKGA